MIGNLKRHPHYGHTLADHPMEHHRHPLSHHGPIVHVKGIIKQVEEDDTNPQGGTHQHIIVDQVEFIDAHGLPESLTIDTIVFCAIRYGDNLGIRNRIPDLEEGEEIELQGEYLDKTTATPSEGNPGYVVIHFTHRPVGFITYHGTEYR
ncbi:hypothetical protein CN575_25615 [Bacillus wiedmannii]|uniref:hypothetical protein n=1 Tax=Bacillus wiedmannii TaxID=1890302 RepID=UPI000BFA1B84|nr:hypothetical protein [Bacillus wiedmannii]PEP29759.1 hypothetical protein CN575_25615 [Bacillus wiedmannii]